jgi:hypothetical protein
LNALRALAYDGVCGSIAPQQNATPAMNASRVVGAVLAVACIAAVLSEGLRTVALASRPYDVDQYRDISAAQALADGGALSDPFYAGETIWYNPLVPALVAAVSRMFSLAPSEAFVAAGPWLNALSVAAFYLMVAFFFGDGPAVIALVSLLILPPHGDPVWSSPSYSPWLFPATFSLGLFYMGLVIVARALESDTWSSWLFTGAWLGLTFLSHTAPAIILAMCVTGAVIARKDDAHRGPSRYMVLVTVFATAAVLSSPFLWSIVWRYHLHIVNAAPNTWVWESIDRRHIATLVRSWLSGWNIWVVAGIIAVSLRGQAPNTRPLVGLWGAAAAVMLVYGWIQQASANSILPAFIPQYHAYLHLRALSHVLVGVGVWWVGDAICAASAKGVARHYRTAVAGIVGAAWIAAAITQSLADYRRRPAFRQHLASALDITWSDTRSDIRNRLRHQLSGDAVVLANAWDSLTIVAANGRRVVAVPREFSNPFVKFEEREWAQRRMLDTLKSGDHDTFLRYAKLYDVGGVVLGAGDAQRVDDLGRLPAGMTELSRRGDVVLYRLSD